MTGKDIWTLWKPVSIISKHSIPEQLDKENEGYQLTYVYVENDSIMELGR